MQNNKIVVVVSGGFDPVHSGHINLLREAKELGDKLVVVLNNDNWLRKKKGFVFMDEEERMVILKSIRYVDEVVLTKHKENTDDPSICNELKEVHPNIFANGGDRKADNIPEYKLCNDLKIKMEFNIGGGKTQSSSELVKKVRVSQL